MAAVSAPQATASTLTPPSSSHGQTSWTNPVPSQTETSTPTSKLNEYPSAARQPLTSNTNGNSFNNSSSQPNLSQRRTDTFNSSHPARSNQATDSGFLAPTRVNGLPSKESSISETGSAPDSLLDLYGPNRSGINSVDYEERNGLNGDPYGDDEDPEHSRWIHRDKLARIESQELQAAGIVLPRARATSKSSRREHSRDQQGNGYGKSEQSGQKRQRIESFPAEEEDTLENIGWDLRLPEEAAEDQGDGFRDMSGGVKGVSRIPISKSSPLPIPIDYLERDTPMLRKQSGGLASENEVIAIPRSRGRSQSIKVLEDAVVTPTPAKRVASDTSPTKKTPAARKASTRTTSAPQRPKPKSGTNRPIKRPEGDPPWLASMYNPDPRLPPEQQLLPTVAKRLQQEQWEREGKFGNVYDKEFRPLNDEEFPEQAAIVPQTVEIAEKKPKEQSEWPLKTERSPTLSTNRPETAGTGSYSTMPKISNHQGSPQGVVLPSPKVASTPLRVQEPAEESQKKAGCGCCVVM